MREQPFLRLRVGFTVLATLAEMANLAWEHVHGGIATHHLLARADLPGISNAWSAVLVPALAWFPTGRIQRRIALHSGGPRAATWSADPAPASDASPAPRPAPVAP